MENRSTPSSEDWILEKFWKMTLISWCVQRKTRPTPFSQVRFIKRYKPDIVALQGVTITSVSDFRERFTEAYLVHFLDGFPYSSFVSFPTSEFEPGVAIASKFPITALPSDHFAIPRAYRALSVVVHTRWRDILVHSVHVPKGGKKGLEKVATLEGIFDRVTRDASTPQILCGVFHAAREETSDGEVITMAHGKRRKSGEAFLRPSKGPRTDQAEHNILLGLGEAGMPDVYRHLHGYEDPAYSYYSSRRDQFVGRRVDHVFASMSLRPIEATYLHEVRELKHSDHSPLKVVFDFEPHELKP